MDQTVNQANKLAVWTYWQALDSSQEPGAVARAGEALLSEDVIWHGPDPINELHGRQALLQEFWQPLCDSFGPLRRETHLFIGGESNGRIDGDVSKDGRYWVSGTGYLHGEFRADYLGIPANGKTVRIRWGEFYRMEGGRAVEIYCLLDLVDLLQQAGIQVLPPSRGKDHLYPAPAAADGVLLEAKDSAHSAATLAHIRAFIFDGLNAFDQEDLTSMGMADYFHPNLKWYGPGGIGACLSFSEFETLHQQPWLHAFPDRQVQNLDALIAEGAYSGGPGWAGVRATHSGDYLGTPASGRPIAVNGLDWWKREGDQLIENWVFVDMIHLFRQMGVDLLANI